MPNVRDFHLIHQINYNNEDSNYFMCRFILLALRAYPKF